MLYNCICIIINMYCVVINLYFLHLLITLFLPNKICKYLRIKQNYLEVKTRINNMIIFINEII